MKEEFVENIVMNGEFVKNSVMNVKTDPKFVKGPSIFKICGWNNLQSSNQNLMD